MVMQEGTPKKTATQDNSTPVVLIFSITASLVFLFAATILLWKHSDTQKPVYLLKRSSVEEQDKETGFKQSFKQESRGSERQKAANELEARAAVYLQNGKATEAESLLKQALQINEAVLGKDHPHVGYRKMCHPRN